MSGKRRENTFRIDYSRIPKKPTYEDLHHLVGVKLGLKREEVLRLQCSRIHGCAFVKTCDLQTAQRIVEEHDGKHTFEVDKKAYTLRMWMEDGGVDVRLYDLSEDVSDVAITEFMAAYGDIISIREVMWEDKYSFGAIPNGVRVVRMVVKKKHPINRHDRWGSHVRPLPRSTFHMSALWGTLPQRYPMCPKQEASRPKTRCRPQTILRQRSQTS